MRCICGCSPNLHSLGFNNSWSWQHPLNVVHGRNHRFLTRRKENNARVGQWTSYRSTRRSENPTGWSAAQDETSLNAPGVSAIVPTNQNAKPRLSHFRRSLTSIVDFLDFLLTHTAAAFRVFLILDQPSCCSSKRFGCMTTLSPTFSPQAPLAS